MMTSAVRRRAIKIRQKGFTLLEMVIVLSITMLVIGGALAALYFNNDEKQLTNAYQEIEVLAKRARTISTLQQRPYALEFRGSTVSLMPFAEAAMEPGDRQEMIEAVEEFSGYDREMGFLEEDAIDQPTDQPTVRDVWTADPEMMLLIKRWATSDWVPITNRDRHVWRFDPNGICEPVGLRVEMEGSWVQVVFHPLTAAIAGMESEMK